MRNSLVFISVFSFISGLKGLNQVDKQTEKDKIIKDLSLKIDSLVIKNDSLTIKKNSVLIIVDSIPFKVIEKIDNNIYTPIHLSGNDSERIGNIMFNKSFEYYRNNKVEIKVKPYKDSLNK